MDLQADQCKREGNECMKKEKYIEAMLHYTKAIKINDEVPTYYSNRSLAFLKIQQYYYALDDAKKVTQMMPKWTRGYYRKGQVEMETEQFEEAIKTFQMGLDLDPGDPKIKESHEKAKVSWQNQRKIERRIPWLGGIFGFVVSAVLIALDEVFAMQKPLLKNDLLKAVVLVAVTAICYGFALVYRFTRRSQRASLIEPPMDLLEDDKPQAEATDKSNSSNTSSKNATDGPQRRTKKKS